MTGTIKPVEAHALVSTSHGLVMMPQDGADWIKTSSLDRGALEEAIYFLTHPGDLTSDRAIAHLQQLLALAPGLRDLAREKGE